MHPGTLAAAVRPAGPLRVEPALVAEEHLALQGGSIRSAATARAPGLDSVVGAARGAERPLVVAGADIAGRDVARWHASGSGERCLAAASGGASVGRGLLAERSNDEESRRTEPHRGTHAPDGPSFLCP
eukprot:COSAG04_NODE_8637_length_947_cov_2.206368_1_plen_129_part_00